MSNRQIATPRTGTRMKIEVDQGRSNLMLYPAGAGSSHTLDIEMDRLGELRGSVITWIPELKEGLECAGLSQYAIKALLNELLGPLDFSKREAADAPMELAA